MNQVKPNILYKAIQDKALQAALNCLSADVLTLPDKIIQLIPPRPPMYYGVGELFQKNGNEFRCIISSRSINEL